MNADVMPIIESIQRETDADAIADIMLRAIEPYGFHSFIISGLPDLGMDFRPFVLLSGWDEDWFDRYAERGYVHHDPVARHSFFTTLPFEWSEALADRQTDEAALRVVEEARDFGLTEGLCVPVHMESGAKGAVSLAGEAAHLGQLQRLELHMLALYVHGRLRFLQTAAPPRRAITAREAEVLKWAAVGKTASEIADITGLTTRTINQHCENAQKRMGTSNRLHTVVEALRQGLITL